MADLVLGHVVFILFSLLATAGGFAIARHFRGPRVAAVTAVTILGLFGVLYAGLRLLLAPFAAPL